METQEAYDTKTVIENDPFKQVENVVRGWVVMSQFRKDLEHFEQLKNSYSYDYD